MTMGIRWAAVLALVSMVGCVTAERAAAPKAICPRVSATPGVPTDNPVATHYANTPEAVPAWTEALPWGKVVSIEDFEGSDDDRVAQAQAAAAEMGGGVVYFPAGTYRFCDHIDLEAGVILRGESPKGVCSAKNEKYALGTKFVFPRYRPSMEGSGTPIDVAFKSIRTKDATAANCGVVNIATDLCHIYLQEEEGHKTGTNRIVFGCLMRNTAAADPWVPNVEYHHQLHQRFTHRHRAAIHVFAARDLFVANNRIAKSADYNFMVKPYALLRVLDGKSQGFRIRNGQPYETVTIEEGVEFDYDNRPGIYANFFGIGAVGAGHANGTPETHPHGFRKGLIIRDNHVYCSGRSAIAFTGDGVICSFNRVVFPKGVIRPTTTGLVCSDGSATNDNRALTMRGYRWHVEGNEYEVHSNMAYGGRIKINDGEGIMHENHHNSIVKDAKLIGNRGNRYLCIWAVPVDGVLIKGNTITAGGAAIHILGRKVSNVTIVENELTAGGIKVTSSKGENVRIENNRYTGAGTQKIIVEDLTWVKANTNLDPVKHVGKQRRKQEPKTK